MLKKITSIFCAVLGIVIIILGVVIDTVPKDFSAEDKYFRYKAEEYDLPYAKFGADFYTDIYEGSDLIVDELNDINKSVEIIVSAENDIYEATSANIKAVTALNASLLRIGRLFVIALGLLTLGLGAVNIGNAFSTVPPDSRRDVLPSPVEEQSIASAE